MNIGQVSKISGVSVRTLHHYESLGLLSPARSEENGYRVYGQPELDTLQQILFFKACGFSLSQIKTLVCAPGFDRAAAFQLQKKHLLNEKERIQTMLNTLEKTMKAMKGEIIMTEADKFKGLDFSKNPYEKEARALWGDEAIDASNAHMGALGKEGQEKLAAGFDALLQELAKVRHLPPESDEAQAAIDKMYRFFNQNFGTYYSLEMFGNLGGMYVADERFTTNIDRYGDGLSQFLSEAMGFFARSMKHAEDKNPGPAKT